MKWENEISIRESTSEQEVIDLPQMREIFRSAVMRSLWLDQEIFNKWLLSDYPQLPGGIKMTQLDANTRLGYIVSEWAKTYVAESNDTIVGYIIVRPAVWIYVNQIECIVTSFPRNWIGKKLWEHVLQIHGSGWDVFADKNAVWFYEKLWFQLDEDGKTYCLPGLEIELKLMIR